MVSGSIRLLMMVRWMKRMAVWGLRGMMLLRDHTRAFNNGKKSEVIGTVGVQWSF